MKALGIATLAVLTSVLGTSCMSPDMIAHAEGKAPPSDPQGPPYNAQPAYYALVPLVLPLDLITLPVQYFYFHSGNGAPPPQSQQQVPPPPADDSRAQF